jgi:hypothetical protein
MSKTNPLEKYELAIEATLEVMAKDILENHVKPFCDEFRLSFNSGMGTYCFYTLDKTRDQRGSDLPDPESLLINYGSFPRPIKTKAFQARYEAIWEILQTRVGGIQLDVGFYLDDYEPTKGAK